METSLFQKLTPISNGDIGTYEEALNFVFNEDDLKNIAITGPYSAGKSSVLETYKSRNSSKKIIHISLAHFETVSQENGKEDTGSYSSLEGKIINQLIHQIDPQKIPQTQFKVKKQTSMFSILSTLLNTVSILVFTVLMAYLLGYNAWTSYVESLDESKLSLFLTRTLNKELMIYSGTTCLIIMAYWIFSLIKVQKEKNILKKVNIYGNEIEIFEENNESYFDKYLNEVLYVLRNMDAAAVVFEDIDRFNDNGIFEKLREINYLANSRSSKQIKFLYLLRDDIFTTKDRTKFFDFILPIVPVIDGSNSYDQFIEHFKKSGLLDKFNENFLQGLSLYIDDMRILKNIYNEFVIYNSRIQSIELSEDKLLAMVTFKNIFPRDFSELQLSKGLVYSLFANKPKFVRKEMQNIDEEIKSIRLKMTTIEGEMLKNIDELDAVFLSVENGFLTVNSRAENSFESRAEFVKAMKESPNSVRNIIGSRIETFDINNRLQSLLENPHYRERKDVIESKATNKENLLQAKIDSLEMEKNALKNKKLNEIINKDNAEEIFNVADQFKSENSNESDRTTDIKTDHYFPLIEYLIRNGFIDETYPDYITYFYENSLSRTDKIFLRSVADQSAKEFGYELKNPSLVVSRLRPIDFSREETLNFHLIEYLLSKENDFLVTIFSQLIEGRKFDFIWQFIETSKKAPTFIRQLNHQWPEIWKVILEEDVFYATQKKKYMLQTIYYTNDEDIDALNRENVLSRYISENERFLDIDAPDIDRIISVLDMIGVKFKGIAFGESNKELFQKVYQSNLYELNTDMLSLIIKQVYHENSEEIFRHSNFSTIRSRREEPLYEYVISNVNKYTGIVLENCAGLISDDEDSIIELLNIDEIGEYEKNLYVKYINTSVTDIGQINETSLWEILIKEKKVVCSANNIIRYYFNYSRDFDSELVEFINNSIETVEFNFNEILERYGESKTEDFINKIVQCNDLSNEKYETFLKNFEDAYEVFDFQEIESEKMQILINLGMILMDKENISFIREHYNEHTFLFIIKNIEDYIELVDNISETFRYEELMQVLRSSEVSNESKLNLLGTTNEIISITDESFSDEITIYILQNNLDQHDLNYLSNNYGKFSEQVKDAIASITIENMEYMISENMEMEFEHLTRVISSSSVEIKDKYSILAIQISNLTKEEIVESLEVLKSEEYLGLFEGNRPTIEINPVNEKILNTFLEKGWITKFEEDNKKTGYYRAFGRRTQKKKSSSECLML